MDDSPKRTWRRFLRFRISTWLLFVGLLAWVMAVRPSFSIHCTNVAVRANLEKPEEIGISIFTRSQDPPIVTYRQWWLSMSRSPSFKWPIIALVAFLAWKGFWLIRARRREEAATQL